MYQEMDETALRRSLGLAEEELPDVLVLFGELSIEWAGRRMSAHLENPRWRRNPPCYEAEYRGLKVILAACFGASMAAHYVHTWCGAGVGNVVQLGWVGGLDSSMAVGDVLVPSHAAREEAVSDWYLPKGLMADASESLASAIAGQMADRKIPVHRGAIHTTPSLLGESQEVIVDWQRHGWRGVDMESAATFAAARHFGAQRAAALILVDDLVGQSNSVMDMAARKASADMLRQREREVLCAALDAVVEAAGQDK